MYTVTKEISRDMAHRLPAHQWLCFNVHWHTYKAMFTLQSTSIQEEKEENAESSMVMDFQWFKVIKKWLDVNRDHAYVWKKGDRVLEFLKKEWFRIYEFDKSPTAEYMSYFLFDRFSKILENLVSVTVYETPTSFSTYHK